jgi:hypothetical protein
MPAYKVSNGKIIGPYRTIVIQRFEIADKPKTVKNA